MTDSWSDKADQLNPPDGKCIEQSCFLQYSPLQDKDKQKTLSLFNRLHCHLRLHKIYRWVGVAIQLSSKQPTNYHQAAKMLTRPFVLSRGQTMHYLCSLQSSSGALLLLVLFWRVMILDDRLFGLIQETSWRIIVNNQSWLCKANFT